MKKLTLANQHLALVTNFVCFICWGHTGVRPVGLFPSCHVIIWFTSANQRFAIVQPIGLLSRDHMVYISQSGFAIVSSNKQDCYFCCSSFIHVRDFEEETSSNK